MDEEEPVPRAAPATPAATPSPDQQLVNSTRQAVTRVTTKLEVLNKEAKKFLKTDPKEDDNIFQAAKMLKLMGIQIDAACSEGTAVVGRALICRIYDLELQLTTLISSAEAGKVACQKALMNWRRAGILAEKILERQQSELQGPYLHRAAQDPVNQ
jgi:hypothetical protein